MYFLLGAQLVYASDFVSGVSYKTYRPRSDQVVHVLKINPSKTKISSVRASETGVSRDTVSNIAKQYNAIAAVNGGFFKLSLKENGNGLPAGILKIANQWHGIAYQTRGAIGWDSDTGEAQFDRLQTKSRLIIAGQSITLHAMNQSLPVAKGVLLSDSYTEEIPQNDTISILIEDNIIADIKDNQSYFVPRGLYVYNVNKTLMSKMPRFKIGDSIELRVTVQPQLDHYSADFWDHVPNILGGGPLLLKNGKSLSDFHKEKINKKFLSDRYARTAVGIDKENLWYIVVAEKTFLSGMSGMTIVELQQFMLSLGCTDALNLDGGGSSTMYLNNNVVNTAEGDEDEGFGSLVFRKVSDVLLIMPNS